MAGVKPSRRPTSRAHTARSSPDRTRSQPPSRALPLTYTITLRGSAGDQKSSIAVTTSDNQFYPLARQWSYVIANRRRITKETRSALGNDIFTGLQKLSGLEPEDLERRVRGMATHGLVEVQIPYQEERVGWAARVFPWESVLALVTKPYREETSSFTVLRHLDVSAKHATRTAPLVASVPGRLLVVRSGPGEIGSLFDLERECTMVLESLQLQSSTLGDPDRAALRSHLSQASSSHSPAVVHVAGVDPLALGWYDLQAVSEEQREGFVLRAGTSYDCVPPLEFARIVTAAPAKPTLVSISTCFSAPRVAALTVAHGALHAIGFQDEVTDADALLFFGVFYRRWARDWNILQAFREARAQLAKQSSPRSGGGVVLWSRKSLLTTPKAARAARAPKRLRKADPRDLRVYVDTKPDRSAGGGRREGLNLNYSLLHNNRSPVRTFVVDKPFRGSLPPLRVEVSLDVGGEACRCRFAEELPEDARPVELAEKIRLPLVAGLLRQCSESLRTNLYIKVECGPHLLCERNEPATVLPADEWRDDGEDHKWLPSFVLPRDPAVLTVIGAAQRYLCTLLDDCSAGFDGYQRLQDDDADAIDVVDPQAQAIWAALQHDLALTYINPPPSYSSQSQRLRSPSQIFEAKAATCIDLALLFASCLEYVGLYPVIFLVTGHAFPGFWRSDKAWWGMKQFEERRLVSSAPPTEQPQLVPEQSTIATGQGEGWLFAGVDNLAELLRYVQAGSLVPFESTFVTAKRGFFEALEEGASRLHPDSFDAMVDVQSARGENVTPLPLLDRRS
jgi:hypothetical protein